jgi:acetolactate synthase I/II/III large subunit
MKLSDYVIDFVSRSGPRHLFLLPGGGSMHLVDSAGRHGGLEYVCCLHEQACAFAAEAYAEYTGGLGAALVTTGPGGTNAITGLAAAWIDSASCLFLSGQVKRADMIGARGVRSMGPQELDIISIVRPITKYAATVMEPESVRYHMEKAVWLATHGRRGPVWIEVPLDIQAAEIEESKLPGFQPPESACDRVLLRSQTAEAIALLNRAERPAVLLGNGARAAFAELAPLLTRLGMPVLTTWKAVDLVPEDHPLFAGRPGLVGQRGANFTQQNADCLLILGARLDLPQTAFDHANFAPGAVKIMVDIDAAEIAKMGTPIHLPLCVDVAAFIQELGRQSEALRQGGREPWLDRVREWRRQYPPVGPEHWRSEEGTVNYYAFLDALSDALKEGETIVPGSSGPCSEVFLQAFRVKRGQRIVNAPGLGAMGTGLPGAIGTCLASGRQRTISIIGDGGFQLNIQDLETVRRLVLPIKFFVLSNGGYASIMGMQKSHFQGRYVASEPSSGLTLPDVMRVAAAYGLQTAKICGHARLREAISDVLAIPGPGVCSVPVSPHQVTAPRATSRLGANGEMVSLPMEDMWPFLSREELAENMISQRGGSKT